MPGGDGTGPMGAGGRCTPLWQSGQIPRPTPVYGRGFFGGFGRGRGFRRMYYATSQPGWVRFGYGQMPVQAQAPATAPKAPVQAPAKEQEISFLEQEQREIESELEAIKKRIAELRKQ